MAKDSQISLALRRHEEISYSLKPVVTSVEPISALSEVDRMLFKQASEGDNVITTTETIFYPQGGDQPADTGTMTYSHNNDMTIFEVSNVRTESLGRILHLGRFDPLRPSPFGVGDRVEQTIDTAKHELHCRLHTAGHILGLAVRSLAHLIPDVVELKAQHYPGAAFVEFRGFIDGKHKAAIQTKTDELVQEDLPVTIDWWNETQLKEKGAIVPDDMVVSGDECLRVVNIEGAGAYPCGGTHIRHTNECGKVEVRKISRKKGISKVSYGIA